MAGNKELPPTKGLLVAAATARSAAPAAVARPPKAKTRESRTCVAPTRRHMRAGPGVRIDAAFSMGDGRIGPALCAGDGEDGGLQGGAEPRNGGENGGVRGDDAWRKGSLRAKPDAWSLFFLVVLVLVVTLQLLLLFWKYRPPEPISNQESLLGLSCCKKKLMHIKNE